ncbi:MAG: ABC transporter permease [Actinobacteria bacterium]|nr:ABC transporter permease [Actinomycetota bacterium]
MTVTPTPPATSPAADDSTTVTDPTVEDVLVPAVPAEEPDAVDDRWLRALRVTGRTIAAILGALAIFGVVMAMKGANPLNAFAEMITTTFSSPKAVGEIFIRGAPIILAALAVTVPARAGLINVGGEGQLVIGGVAAAGVSLALGTGASPGLAMALMIMAALVAGALWAGLAAALRLWVGINESVTTLLMNYIALDFMLFLIYDPWKDRQGSGQPATPAIPVGERLPLIGTSRVHMGIAIALIATAAVWLVFKKTSWGFRLGVVGGNAEAARRAGLRVGVLLLSAMAVGGALAGLGGFVQLAGTEFKLRPGFLVTYGYIGFLASWLAKHRPVPVLLSALLLSAIAIGGDSLQLDSKLPAASVNILMALLLLAVFGFSKSKKAMTA